MMVKIARSYIVILFLIDLMLPQRRCWCISARAVGNGAARRKNRSSAAGWALIANFVVLCLAKEGNVWKNEFKASPAWVRGLAIAFGCYGLGVAIFQTVLSYERQKS